MVQIDIIKSRAEQLSTLLRQSQSTTQDACTTLDTYRRKLREVDRMIQPVSQRANTITQVRESLRSARSQVEEVQDNLDTAKQVEGQVVLGPAKDFAGFLRAFERLEVSINFLQGHKDVVSREATLSDSLRLRDMGLRMAADYFSELLRQHTSVPPTSLLVDMAAAIASGGASGPALELMPPAVCKRLRRLSELLLRNGDRRCLEVYGEARGGVLRQVVSGLGGEAAVKDPHVSWDMLQEKIESWIRGMAVVATMVQPERSLAQSVFPDDQAEVVYYGVLEPVLRGLLTLGAALCQAPRRLVEKLFGLLDMHDNLHQLLPPMADALEGAKVQRVLLAFISLDKDVQLECRDTFAEFVDQIKRPNLRDLMPDGSVDRYAVYVLNYVKRLTANDAARAIVFSGKPPQDVMDRSFAQDPQLPERLASQLRMVLDTLVRNCDAKSKAYKTKPLGCLSMMNNLHHIVTRVEKSNVLSVVGQAWIEGMKDDVESWGGEYIDTAWGPLINMVKEDPGKVGKDKVKETLKALSSRLEEIQANETSWQIPDEVLRENLRDVISDDFAKPYDTYLARFEAAFPSKVSKYKKYAKFDSRGVSMIIFHKLFIGEQDETFRHSESLLETVGR